ncbi:MAG: stalk domain-containing protein [Cellulosilyticaceae bacterium]
MRKQAIVMMLSVLILVTSLLPQVTYATNLREYTIICDGVPYKAQGIEKDGTTYFKLRDIAQALAYTIDYDNSTREIILDHYQGGTLKINTATGNWYMNRFKCKSAPLINYNDTNYVPIRAICFQYGFEVSYTDGCINVDRHLKTMEIPTTLETHSNVATIGSTDEELLYEAYFYTLNLTLLKYIHLAKESLFWSKEGEEGYAAMLRSVDATKQCVSKMKDEKIKAEANILLDYSQKALEKTRIYSTHPDDIAYFETYMERTTPYFRELESDVCDLSDLMSTVTKNYGALLTGK